MLGTLTLVAMLAAGPGLNDVREHGAKGDKQAVDTAAIQAAIDACAQNGGGTVFFPPGDYLSGGLRLKSGVVMELSPGATLWASARPEDYPEGRPVLILAEDQERIGLRGDGRIHGQGTADYGRSGNKDEPKPGFRTRILQFTKCRDVFLRAITVLYSDSWALHFKQCENVLVDGVTIRNNYFRVNSDGIDPDSCRNVRIANCHIVAGDDCIVLKSTEPEPCENVVVTNCTLETIATALKLGTESRGDFRNIHFSNCTIRNTRLGIGLLLKDGATMEAITFSDISIETADPKLLPHAAAQIMPIFVDIERRHPDSRVGTIRDLTFRNIVARTDTSIVIQGMPESAIENLTMDNVSLRIRNGEDFGNRTKVVGGRRTAKDERDTLYVRQPAYITIAHARDLALDNVKVWVPEEVGRQYPRSAFAGFDLEGAVLRNVCGSAAGPDSQQPLLALHDCRRVLVTDCVAPPGTRALVEAHGERCRDIRFGQNIVPPAEETAKEGVK